MNKGEIVKLKSGGPVMTIKDVRASDGLCYCVWFEGTEMKQGAFPPEALLHEKSPK